MTYICNGPEPFEKIAEEGHIRIILPRLDKTQPVVEEYIHVAIVDVGCHMKQEGHPTITKANLESLAQVS